MIKVNGVTFSYKGVSKPAVKDVSFSVERGQIFGLLGPSGAGKTTLQNIMIGLQKIQKGQVLYDNRNIAELGKGFFNRIGFSFEAPNLYEKLSGLENLKFYEGLYNVPTIAPKELLKMLELEGAGKKWTADYSKGMKQRLVFARAIMNKPEFLFLDEPTSGLDPGTARTIIDLINAEKKRGATIILTTHNMMIADELCDIVAFINEGSIVSKDSPRNLKLDHGQKTLKVEWRDNGKLESVLLSIGKAKDREEMKSLLDSKKIETIHSQEATLEEIFIKLTGRGLS